MVTLKYNKKHNIYALLNELEAVPELKSISLGNGMFVSKLTLGEIGDEIQVYLSDDTLASKVDAVVAAHTNPPIGPLPKTIKQLRDDTINSLLIDIANATTVLQVKAIILSLLIELKRLD